MTAQAPYESQYQDRVGAWMDACFPKALYGDMTQRCDRFLEEALELLQAMGYDRSRVATLVDYVWNRPVGEAPQEVGGTVVTLAALCWVAGIGMHAEAWRELERIERPEVMAKIRAKQEAKNALHFDSPLPGTAALAARDVWRDGDGGIRAATEEESDAIDKAAGLTKIVLRLPTDLYERLDSEATAYGCVLPAFIRHLLGDASVTPPPDAAPAVSDAVRAIREVREAELFEDGCEADLHDAGVTTIPGAYMAGRMDALDEVEQALSASPAGRDALVREVIDLARKLGPWDGKTFNEELHAKLRQLVAKEPTP